MYFIGFDIGSSSIKVSLVEEESGKPLALVQEPEQEMDMISVHPGWAEQDPELWWKHFCTATKKILHQTKIPPDSIAGIGISYQMHGLVLVDKNGRSLRPSIIWCDGRAVDIGQRAEKNLGIEWCTNHLLNSPANFTASKLKWVAENEAEIFDHIHKIMLPGDYIAFKLTGEIASTISGLSEGIFWDFKESEISQRLLEYYGLSPSIMPPLVSTFGEQGQLTQKAALETGLAKGTAVLYRAGDQPNNALSLNVFEPGEIAATAGTSGVFYAVTDRLETNIHSGVNNFAHVNYAEDRKRIGKLLCINGTGIQYRWLLNNLDVQSYEQMNQLANGVPIGSDGLMIHPFGNGPERMLNNQLLGGQISGLEFNRHTKAHLCRAALEGIAFSFAYGMELLREEDVEPAVIRAGNDNMFRSDIFSQSVVNCIENEISIYNNTGATGAARACILRNGDFKSYGDMVERLDFVNKIIPTQDADADREAYASWKSQLNKILKYQ